MGLQRQREHGSCRPTRSRRDDPAARPLTARAPHLSREPASQPRQRGFVPGCGPRFRELLPRASRAGRSFQASREGVGRAPRPLQGPLQGPLTHGVQNSVARARPCGVRNVRRNVTRVRRKGASWRPPGPAAWRTTLIQGLRLTSVCQRHLRTPGPEGGRPSAKPREPAARSWTSSRAGNS